MARHKPACPVLAFTPDADTCRRLALVWGCLPVLLPMEDEIGPLLEGAMRAAGATGLVKAGESVVITAGVPLRTSGITNLIKVQKMGADLPAAQ